MPDLRDKKGDRKSMYIDSPPDLCSVTVEASWQNQVLLIPKNMVVRHRLMTWCFFFQLLLLLITVIEGSKNIEENNLDLSDRVSKIEAKDRLQDSEMFFLKNALDEEKKLVHELTNRVAILEGSNKNAARQKRPYRLLPMDISSGTQENKTDAEDESHIRFYGPATGCSDLGRLGYTLNGFYLVQEKENKSTNSNSSSKIKQIEIVECRFKQNPKAGNQSPDDKEKRLGFIRTSYANNDYTSFFRSDVKEDMYSKEVSVKEKEFGLTPTPNDSNNNKLSHSDKKGKFDMKDAEDKEKRLKFTTRINKVKRSSTIQPRLDKKPYCLFKWRSEMHKYASPKKLTNLCLVAADRKSKKNGSTITTDEPEYYIAQLPCDSVKDEEHWTRRKKHICSNKNNMCLTVSPNIKDGGVLVNLMPYEESAKSQQWTNKENGIQSLVTLKNVGTSVCLFEPSYNQGKRKANTMVKACPTDTAQLNYLYYFEKVNFIKGKNCTPF